LAVTAERLAARAFAPPRAQTTSYSLTNFELLILRKSAHTITGCPEFLF
jgi:hypothetical protein